MKATLQTARALGLLRAVDTGFAQVIGELDAQDNDTLMLLAALLSHATGQGNVCLSLDAVAGTVLALPGDNAPLVTVPDTGLLKKALLDSVTVGRPGDDTPLVLDASGRLYLGRYWHYEQQVAEDLLRLAANVPVTTRDATSLKSAFAQLFPAAEGETDWQAVAAALALTRQLAVISGGPGTGKTRTVASLLALLLQQAGEDELRIRLAAPTGKAAARLTEAIRQARMQLHVSQTLKERIPDQASTLHRLIGIRPGSPPRYRIDNPLPVDVLVVDEASMIDLPMMAKVLHALPSHARLVLLGDKDQLASVEAGSVFADITGARAGSGYSASMLEQLQHMTGQNLSLPQVSPGFGDCVALLRKSWRFEKESGIGALAAAINAGDTRLVLDLVAGEAEGLTRRVVAARDVAKQLQPFVEHSLAPVFSAKTPEEALDELSRFRILSAVRRGPFGVEQLNRTTEALLRAQGFITTRSEQYRGRPVMISRNEPALNLFNGDVGILWPDPDDGHTLKAWFRLPDNAIRALSLPRLPAHETTWAMTVHKSQGSEFDHVLLVLPDETNPVLTRELLYTGVTRARLAVDMWANDEVINHCVRTPVERASGLMEKLYGG